MVSIYKITNPKGKIYIGQTKNVVKRQYAYKSLHCKRQIKLYNSINKYGWDNHIFEILEITSIENKNYKEKEYISKFNSFNDGLNLTEGGTDAPLTESQKIKISLALMGSKNIKAKRIFQYSLEGVLIKEWGAMKDVERELGFPTTCLSGGIKSQRPRYGFIWSHGDFYEPKQLSVSYNNKPIYMYSLVNILIMKFTSIKEACKYTGLNRITIRRNIQKISKSKKFIFTEEPLTS